MPKTRAAAELTGLILGTVHLIMAHFSTLQRYELVFYLSNMCGPKFKSCQGNVSMEKCAFFHGFDAPFMWGSSEGGWEP